MSIVKMKRLRAIGMSAERDGLLQALQRLGCVQVDTPDHGEDSPHWAALTRVDSALLGEKKAQIAALSGALATLGRYAKAKGGFLTPRPEISERALFDDAVRAEALAAAQVISDGERQMASLQSESVKAKAQKRTLAPWLEIDVPLDIQPTRTVSFTFGALSAQADYSKALAALEEASPLSQLFPGGKDREFQYVLLVCHRSEEAEALEALKGYGFSRAPLRGWSGTARENTAALDRRLEEIEAELIEQAAGIAAQAEHREAIRRAIDRLSQDAAREETKGRLLESRTAFFLEGWVPVSEVGRLEEVLSAFACAWETEDPVKDDYPQVPVKLKNNVVTRPLTMVTEMYSLPAYDGVDPNPLMMPFFVFFFGFMFADLGYGLILAGASYFILKKARPKGTMGHLLALMLECGIGAAIIGFFTGGFFSDAIATISTLFDVPTPSIPFLTVGPLLNVTSDPMTVLIFAMGVGLVQIIVGMAVNAYLLLREGNWKDAIFDVFTWWVIFAGIAVFAAAGSSLVLAAGGVLLVAGALLRASYPFERGIVAGLLLGLSSAVVGLFATLYNNVTGYFGDILSYSRLMVMMLAGSVIGSIFNLLGSMPGNVFIFAVIFVVGHVFNMGLNIIGTYVHTSRLQYLEYFGKFYREGGRPFRPLNFTTNYVDIKEET